MIPGCICMSFGYLSIIVLRNKPSDVGLPDFNIEPKPIETKEDENEADDNIVKDEQLNENKDNNEEVEEEDTEHEPSRLEQFKLILKYPFFISICLIYFQFQLVKTLFCDWSQIYLTKIIKVDHYTGNFLFK